MASDRIGDRWLKVREVAKRLGVHPHDVYRLIRRKELPAKRLSTKRIRVSEQALERFVESREDV